MNLLLGSSGTRREDNHAALSVLRERLTRAPTAELDPERPQRCAVRAAAAALTALDARVRARHRRGPRVPHAAASAPSGHRYSQRVPSAFCLLTSASSGYCQLVTRDSDSLCFIPTPASAYCTVHSCIVCTTHSTRSSLLSIKYLYRSFHLNPQDFLCTLLGRIQLLSAHFA